MLHAAILAAALILTGVADHLVLMRTLSRTAADAVPEEA